MFNWIKEVFQLGTTDTCDCLGSYPREDTDFGGIRTGPPQRGETITIVMTDLPKKEVNAT